MFLSVFANGLLSTLSLQLLPLSLSYKLSSTCKSQLNQNRKHARRRSLDRITSATNENELYKIINVQQQFSSLSLSLSLPFLFSLKHFFHIVLLLHLLTTLCLSVVDAISVSVLHHQIDTSNGFSIVANTELTNHQYYSRENQLAHQPRLTRSSNSAKESAFFGQDVEALSGYEDGDMFQQDQSDSMLMNMKNNHHHATALVSVVSGQKAILSCPVLTDGSSKKLIQSSAADIGSSASAASIVSGSSSASSTKILTIPIKWQKESTILPYDHRQHVHANGTLIISSVQKRTDEGSYYCYLYSSEEELSDLKDSKERTEVMLKNSGLVNLKVMDPPRVGPYEFPNDLQVGMKARAMCSVMQGDPPFRFLWTQDSHRIEPDVPTSDTGAIFRTQHFRDYSMLTVDSLTLSHAGNITCIVSNDAGKTSQSSLLKVNAPPQWLVEPQDSRVILHQSVRIDCLASGSPKPFTTWKRATGVSGSPWEYVPVYNAVHYYLHPNGSLTIKSATQAQAGPYICQSTNGYGSDIGKLIHVKINEPPRFHVQSISQSAHKDKPVRLLCPPEGDSPIHMEWFLINGTLLNNNNNNNNNDNDNDELDNPTRDNHLKISLSATENAKDKFLFEIKKISPKFLNEEINLNNIGDSSNVNSETMNEISLNNGETTTQQQNLIVSMLTIRKPVRDDSRIYVCKASNEFGWAELKIRLIVKEKPDVPEEFSIQNVTESSSEIRWRESFNGNSAIVNYVVEYRLAETNTGGSSSGSTKSTTTGLAISSSSPSLSTINTITIPMDRVSANGSLRSTIVNDLRPNTLYNIRIAAANRIGQSDFSAWIRFRTDQSAPESPPLDVTATPTGPNSVKITWKNPKKSSWNGEISGYYIGYRAEKSDTDLYKTVENGNLNGKHESHITNLHRSTVYKAWVQAFNTRGTGPRSEIVSVQTLADVPPSAPLLRLHSSTSDSITISWSSSTYGSRSTNDLTLFYRAYQPANVDHPLSIGSTKIIHNPASNQISNNNWRDISILEPNGRHTVTGLECGRSYEFFATAHNSVGKSEPSTPLVARTRGDVPMPPPRNNLLNEATNSPYGIVVNLLNWKYNECPINHFSLRIRPKSTSAGNGSINPNGSNSGSALITTTTTTTTTASSAWSVLSMQHNPRENFILKKLTPNTAYEIEITAHSSAGSTQVIHQFITPNNSNESFLNKMGFDSKISLAYPMPSSTSEISFSDYEILLPVISSLIVVVVIVAVACFLCSRDHHSLFLQSGLHVRQRKQSTSSENKVPFHQQEMSILKELVRSGSMADTHTDSMMMSSVHHAEPEYNCINREPASTINSEHLNHHHHHLISSSPRHQANTKKDIVELQSFFNHQSSQVTTTAGCHYRTPVVGGLTGPNAAQLESAKNRQTNTGNYALPYDVLPVCRDNNNVSSIYGQRELSNIKTALTAVAVNSSNPNTATASGLPVPNNEALYATAKLISNFNYCPKPMDDTSQSSDNNNTQSSLSLNRANYESLVPMICSAETHR